MILHKVPYEKERVLYWFPTVISSRYDEEDDYTEYAYTCCEIPWEDEHSGCATLVLRVEPPDFIQACWCGICYRDGSPHYVPYSYFINNEYGTCFLCTENTHPQR